MSMDQGFRKILVPVDFSDASEAVLATAIRVLHPEGRAMLLHIVEWMPAVTQGTFGVYPHRKDIDSLMHLSRGKLEEYVREHPNVSLDIEVQEGKPSAAILEFAQAFQPDLIVIGAHGRSRLDHLLIGSVAERVLRKATCHVLAVRM
jgi:nucleotide-binding universal stress UspA family protein